MTANFDQVLTLLAEHGVRFVLIGGGAAIAHGSARATYVLTDLHAGGLHLENRSLAVAFL